jgi:hypothetical protein
MYIQCDFTCVHTLRFHIHTLRFHIHTLRFHMCTYNVISHVYIHCDFTYVHTLWFHIHTLRFHMCTYNVISHPYIASSHTTIAHIYIHCDFTFVVISYTYFLYHIGTYIPTLRFHNSRFEVHGCRDGSIRLPATPRLNGPCNGHGPWARVQSQACWTEFVSGWQDWANFRLFGGCLLCAIFWKLQT